MVIDFVFKDLKRHWEEICSQEKQGKVVWLCGEEGNRGMGEEMGIYGGQGGGWCKDKREAKKDLVGSG